MKKTNLIKSISALSLAALPLSSIAFLTSCSTHAPLAYADILTANDIHGAIDQKTDTSAPAISCLLNEYLKAIDEDKKVTDREDSTYMLLNGDIVQGNNMTVFSDPVGAWIWDIIGSLPYQYSSIGNHETDWGLDTMQTSFSQMGHLKWLCCNISMDRNGLEPGINIQRYTIQSIGGLNVGIVGYTSPDLDNQPWEVSKDYHCSDARDGVEGTKVLQDAIDDCWNNTDPNICNGEKPDAVLLLAHAGAIKDTTGNPDPDNPEYSKDSEIFNVIHNINGIDGCLSSHSHFPYVLDVKDKDGKKIPTGQADWHSESLLQTKIYYSPANKKEIKVAMEIRSTHTEKCYDDLEYAFTWPMMATAVKYLMYYSKVQEINDVQSLVIKANNEADATFVKSKTLDGYGEIPVLGNIFTKLMVNTLTKERITDSGEDNPFKTTRDEMSDFGWFSGDNQFNGLDFYLDGDDTTASTIAPSIAKTSITPYGGAFSYGDITKAWKFQQAIYIIKATGKDLKDYYLNKNCNKKSNSYNMIDPIYSKKYKLYYNGTTVANSTAIKFVDNDGNELKDNDTIYIGINSFMRDNRAKDYFHKYSAHSDKACVTVSTDWVIKHPATGEDYHINGYYGNTFAFIYSARLLGGYDETNKDKVMIDLTDPTSIYHFDPTEHFVHF